MSRLIRGSAAATLESSRLMRTVHSLGYPSEVLPLACWLAKLSFLAVELGSFRPHHRTAFNSSRLELGNFHRCLIAHTIRESPSIHSESFCVLTHATVASLAAENVALLLEFGQSEATRVLLGFWQQCLYINPVAITSDYLGSAAQQRTPARRKGIGLEHIGPAAAQLHTHVV